MVASDRGPPQNSSGKYRALLTHTPGPQQGQGRLAARTLSSPTGSPSCESASVFCLHSPRSASPLDKGVRQRCQSDTFAVLFLVWKEASLAQLQFSSWEVPCSTWIALFGSHALPTLGSLLLLGVRHSDCVSIRPFALLWPRKKVGSLRGW